MRQSAVRCSSCLALLHAIACHNTTAVDPGSIARVSLGAVGGFAMNAGQTTRLVVTLFDSSNAVVTGPAVAFASSDTSVASVSKQGVVSARAPGHSTITAQSGRSSATATLSVVPAVPQFARIDVGGSMTCGLTSAASLYCWRNALGYGSSHGNPQLIDNSRGFQFVSVGSTHQCALTGGGIPYCWGDNSNGELGTGDSATASVPVAVGGGLAFQAISAGHRSTCALTSQGDAYCWGANFTGELGDGTTTSHPLPAKVSGNLHLQSISIGSSSACGLTTAGAAYCWGDNFSGQLGTGNAAASSSPALVSGGLVFRSVSVGFQHACGVTTAGTAYCWGGNLSGSLGNGTHDSAPHSAPVLVTGGLTWLSVTAGEDMTCGVATTGVTYCWGSNLYDLLGSGIQTYHSDAPAVAWGGLVFQSVSARGDHACALAAGVVYCWGGYVS